MSDREEKKAEEEKKDTEPTDNKKLIVDNLSPRQIIELDACTRCGECLEWCPVYNQDEREGVTPRAKATRFKKILSSPTNFDKLILNKSKSDSNIPLAYRTAPNSRPITGLNNSTL